jgi:Domain of unknown function (DUF397)
VSDANNDWFKSSFSGSGDCVEVKFAAGTINVRDSKDPQGPVLTFNDKEWAAFLRGVDHHEFDLPS